MAARYRRSAVVYVVSFCVMLACEWVLVSTKFAGEGDCGNIIAPGGNPHHDCHHRVADYRRAILTQLVVYSVISAVQASALCCGPAKRLVVGGKPRDDAVVVFLGWHEVSCALLLLANIGLRCYDVHHSWADWSHTEGVFKILDVIVAFLFYSNCWWWWCAKTPSLVPPDSRHQQPTLVHVETMVRRLYCGMQIVTSLLIFCLTVWDESQRLASTESAFYIASVIEGLLDMEFIHLAVHRVSALNGSHSHTSPAPFTVEDDSGDASARMSDAPSPFSPHRRFSVNDDCTANTPLHATGGPAYNSLEDSV